MAHCSACSFDGNEKAIEKHQKERRHSGVCEGKWESVSRQSSLFLTQDSQFVCFTCDRHCVKPYIPYNK